MKHIANIKTDFVEKFGLPRQASIIPELKGKIIFKEEYRNIDCIRGLGEFSHIWILWEFSENINKPWKPLIRPPKLGGNKKIGVFASRSPFRPNPLGMSCVKLERIEENTSLGPVLYVSGIDMIDGTPIYDIKPYIPIADAIVYAKGGFTERIDYKKIDVNIPYEIEERYDQNLIKEIVTILSENIKPAYHKDDRIYGMSYKGFNISFHYYNDVIVIDEIRVI